MPSHGLKLFQVISRSWTGLTPEKADPRELGNNFREQFEPFSVYLAARRGQPRDICAGARQTRHEPAPNSIAGTCHDNGSFFRRAFSSSGCFIPDGNDNFTIEAD